MKKRILALLLAVLSLCSLLAVGASAVDSNLNVLLMNAEAYRKNVIVLDFDTYLDSNAVIPFGITLIVPANKKLTIAKNVKLNVLGQIIVFGEFVAEEGSIENPANIIRGGDTPSYPGFSPLTYTCTFCGQTHAIGTACPIKSGSYYCPVCQMAHPAGYTCYYYGRYFGYQTYYCQYCDQYHPVTYYCEKYEQGSFTYCKDCKAFHVTGAICGPLASPTKYYYDKDCGHYHKVGEEVNHGTIFCPTCRCYHAAGEQCHIQSFYSYVFCPICKTYHIDGIHVLPYCETCKTYHAEGQHVQNYCPICGTCHAEGQHVKTYCSICKTYHIPGQHTAIVTPVNPYTPYIPYNPYQPVTPIIPGNNTGNIFDATDFGRTFEETVSVLTSRGLSTDGLKLEATFGGISKLSTQDFLYIVYATLLNSGKITAAPSDSPVLKNYVNRAHISNIGDYKSAFVFFATVINDYSINPRSEVPLTLANNILAFVNRVTYKR